MTGFATSVIGCGCEAGIDRELTPERNARRAAGRARAPVRRLDERICRSSCRLASVSACSPCPGSACYAGLDGEETLKLGDALRYFGDGWQISKRLGGRHYWRIPVMDGEFVCEATTGLTKSAVGGGNLLIMGAKRRHGARGGRSSRAGDRRGAGRHHAVSRRHRALRLEGRLEIQGRTPRPPTMPIARR